MTFKIKLLHLGAIGLYIYVSNFLLNLGRDSPDPIEPRLKAMGQLTFRFLTNWTFGLQLLYFALSVLGYFLDIVPAFHKTRDKFQKVTNVLFTTLVTPIAFVVSLTFWALYIMDRELVYPKFVDSVIPVWINHTIHTFNSVIPIVEMYLVKHTFPSWAVATKAIVAYLGTYGICLYGTYFQMGIWVYPFLNQLTWTQRHIFGVANLLFALSLYAVAKFMNQIIWGSATNKPTKSKKTKQKSKKVS